MLNNLLHFIKYNNATIIILAIILVLGGGALAAGPEAIGVKQTSVQGTDNTALLSADLNNFNMDFKIENIQADEQYYYVTYSYLDLVVIDGAWQYQLSSKTQKVSKKIKQDIGDYMAKFMAKHHEARVRELTAEKNQAESQGEQKRVEVTEYSGLVGKTLDLAAKVFPGYEPVVKREVPSPEISAIVSSPSASSGQADNLTQVYNNYIAAHPDLISSLETSISAGELDAATTTEQNIEATSTPPADIVIPETPAATEPTSVQVITLPEATPTPAPAPIPTPDTTTTPAAATDATPAQ